MVRGSLQNVVSSQACVMVVTFEWAKRWFFVCGGLERAVSL